MHLRPAPHETLNNEKRITTAPCPSPPWLTLYFRFRFWSCEKRSSMSTGVLSRLVGSVARLSLQSPSSSVISTRWCTLPVFAQACPEGVGLCFAPAVTEEFTVRGWPSTDELLTLSLTVKQPSFRKGDAHLENFDWSSTAYATHTLTYTHCRVLTYHNNLPPIICWLSRVTERLSDAPARVQCNKCRWWWKPKLAVFLFTNFDWVQTIIARDVRHLRTNLSLPGGCRRAACCTEIVIPPTRPSTDFQARTRVAGNSSRKWQKNTRTLWDRCPWQTLEAGGQTVRIPQATLLFLRRDKGLDNPVQRALPVPGWCQQTEGPANSGMFTPSPAALNQRPTGQNKLWSELKIRSILEVSLVGTNVSRPKLKFRWSEPRAQWLVEVQCFQGRAKLQLVLLRFSGHSPPTFSRGVAGHIWQTSLCRSPIEPCRSLSSSFPWYSEIVFFPGRVWVRSRGGGHKKNYRMIAWVRGGSDEAEEERVDTRCKHLFQITCVISAISKTPTISTRL